MGEQRERSADGSKRSCGFQAQAPETGGRGAAGLSKGKKIPDPPSAPQLRGAGAQAPPSAPRAMGRLQCRRVSRVGNATPASRQGPNPRGPESRTPFSFPRLLAAKGRWMGRKMYI